VDDGSAFRLNTDRDAGTAQAVAFHRHEGNIRRLKAADHPRFDAFFLNTGDHFAQDIFMRNADDIGGLRQTKRRPDGNNDFILLCAGFGFADFRQEAVAGHRRNGGRRGRGDRSRRRVKGDRLISACFHLHQHLFDNLAQQLFVNFHFSPLSQVHWDRARPGYF